MTLHEVQLPPYLADLFAPGTPTLTAWRVYYCLACWPAISMQTLIERYPVAACAGFFKCSKCRKKGTAIQVSKQKQWFIEGSGVIERDAEGQPVRLYL